jgi:hypothetical protein
MGEIGAEFSSKQGENRLNFIAHKTTTILTFVNQTKFVVNGAGRGEGGKSLLSQLSLSLLIF